MAVNAASTAPDGRVVALTRTSESLMMQTVELTASSPRVAGEPPAGGSSGSWLGRRLAENVGRTPPSTAYATKRSGGTSSEVCTVPRGRETLSGSLSYTSSAWLWTASTAGPRRAPVAPSRASPPSPPTGATLSTVLAREKRSTERVECPIIRE
eukprot:scaffold200497_cov31-Tisochrysis_lutea.AAC.3